MPNHNTTPSTGGVGMDNEIGGVVVGLLEKKKEPLERWGHRRGRRNRRNPKKRDKKKDKI